MSDETIDVRAGRRGLPRAVRPFRHRDYRALVASMGVSLFASGMWLARSSGR